MQTKKHKDINDTIILSGKFINPTTQEIIYVFTPKSDMDRVQEYFKKSGYTSWMLIFMVFIVYIDMIFDKDKQKE